MRSIQKQNVRGMRPGNPQVNELPVQPDSPNPDLERSRDNQESGFRIRHQDIRRQANQVLGIWGPADLTVVSLAPIARRNAERDADELPSLIQEPHERVADVGPTAAGTGELAGAEVLPLSWGHRSNSFDSLLLLPSLIGGLDQVEQFIQGRGCSCNLGSGCKDWGDHEGVELMGELIKNSVELALD